jgi:sec-independent protein translocase protein TatA
MFGLDNPVHLLFLLGVLLLLFGAKRLPEMGRSLGAGLRGFKESITGEAGSPEAVALSRGADNATTPVDERERAAL